MITDERAPSMYPLRSVVTSDSSRFWQAICTTERSILEVAPRDSYVTRETTLRGHAGALQKPARYPQSTSGHRGMARH